MPVEKLKKFLDEKGVRYVTMIHSRAYSAQQVAAAAHIPGKELAKTVMVKLDGDLAMAVVPASYRVNMKGLAWGAGVEHAELATEAEFAELFPNCELGAMPPFGHLWGLRVFASESLAEDEQISFEGGTHTEVISLAFEDFRRLVEPRIMVFSSHV